VATEDSELSRLETLYERAKINNVPDVRLVEKDQIKDIEPYCQVRLFTVTLYSRSLQGLNTCKMTGG